MPVGKVTLDVHIPNNSKRYVKPHVVFETEKEYLSYIRHARDLGARVAWGGGEGVVMEVDHGPVDLIEGDEEKSDSSDSTVDEDSTAGAKGNKAQAEQTRMIYPVHSL